jgi:hypothetical protein
MLRCFTFKSEDDQIEESNDLDDICELPMRIAEVLERSGEAGSFPLLSFVSEAS